MGQECRHPAAADPAKLDFRRRELGIVGGDADIAAHRRLKPAAQGIAIHGGDGRLQQLADRIAIIRAIAELPGRLIAVEFLDIGPGAEGALARAGDDHDADRVAVVAGLDRVDDRLRPSPASRRSAFAAGSA